MVFSILVFKDLLRSCLMNLKGKIYYSEASAFTHNYARSLKKSYELGGVVSGEHGVGKGKRDFFLQNTPDEYRSLMLGVKKSFDEFNLLNPHSGYGL